ncbi:hypothetical protein [Larkinella soli]|uniref:hypothetical protein n=1 Tax=Larkinella soli TaxID=1770527 RepID=UPI000FFBF5DF|nr:hypothetical protein [Larkinella soli]
MIRAKITISRAVVIDDGAGGSTQGEAEDIFTTSGSVKFAKPTMTLENLQQGFGMVLVFDFWNQNVPELRAGDTLSYGGSAWTLQGPPLPLDETQRVLRIIAIQR